MNQVLRPRNEDRFFHRGRGGGWKTPSSVGDRGVSRKMTVFRDEKTLLVRPGFGFISQCHVATDKAFPTVMTRCRMQVFYSGRVQGVGFRYTVRTVAAGFEIAGTVRNLADGRVELVAEGDKKELEAFREAIREAGLAANIRNEDAVWGEATGGFRGFEIVS